MRRTSSHLVSALSSSQRSLSNSPDLLHTGLHSPDPLSLLTPTCCLCICAVCAILSHINSYSCESSPFLYVLPSCSPLVIHCRNFPPFQSLIVTDVFCFFQFHTIKFPTYHTLLTGWPIFDHNLSRTSPVCSVYSPPVLFLSISTGTPNIVIPFTSLASYHPRYS